MTATLDSILKDAPAAVRRAMIEDSSNLPAGAAAVMGRFWTANRKLSGNPALPPTEAYRYAAQSESTFRCLLRMLVKYAPHVATAPARIVSDEWYAQRSKPMPKATRKGPRPIGATWPEEWQKMLPALDRASLTENSKKRYIASIDRCAAIVSEGLASDTFSFLSACALAEAFVLHPDKAKRVKPVTAASYIWGLITLGAKGGVREESLAAMRVIFHDLKDQSKLDEKNKYERLSNLMERGGYGYVAERVGELRARAQLYSDHSALRRRFMQQAVICAVILNKPVRRGDIVSWRLGEQLVRDIDGTWRAEWVQRKTGLKTETAGFGQRFAKFWMNGFWMDIRIG